MFGLGSCICLAHYEDVLVLELDKEFKRVEDVPWSFKLVKTKKGDREVICSAKGCKTEVCVEGWHFQLKQIQDTL